MKIVILTVFDIFDILHLLINHHGGDTMRIRIRKFAGAGWLEAQGIEMSDLGRATADLLGDVFLGIYHIDSKPLRKAAWNQPLIVEVPIQTYLSTYDSDELTRLVVLSHDRLLRLEIKWHTRGWLLLRFSQRKDREGELWDRLPTLEAHAAMIRGYYGCEEAADALQAV